MNMLNNRTALSVVAALVGGGAGIGLAALMTRFGST